MKKIVTKAQQYREALRRRLKKFEKELIEKPATVDELWLAVSLMSDEMSSRNARMVALDYVWQARELTRRLSNPGELIPFEEVLKKYKLEEV